MANNGGPLYDPNEVAHDQYEPNDDSENDPEDGEANDDETASIAETFHDPDYDLEDGDDDLFLKYVHEVMQEETLPSNVGGSDIMYSNEEEYCDSDRLLSDNSEDGEGMQYPDFIAEKDMENPEFITGMKFRSVVEFRAAIRNYSIKNRCSDIKLNPNEKNRCQGKCKQGCPWKIWASSIDDGGTLQIKSYTSKHTCSRDRKNRKVSSKWLAHKFLDYFRIDPDWKVELFEKTVKEEVGVQVSRTVSWKTRRHAKKLLDGDEVVEFGKLGAYAAEILRSNPGSTILIHRHDYVFKAIYICLNAIKKNFVDGCRRVVSLDGCFLKGKFGGHLLSAVGIDGNDCMFPIAYAVVEKENNYFWRWFLNLLVNDLGMGNNSKEWVIMSDRQKGLQNVVAELLPGSEHRFCVRHMYANFFRKDFKGKTLKDYLWMAARATYEADFRDWMGRIKNEKNAAYEWLEEKNPSEWSKSHFRTFSKCDMLLNNLCECFNNYILDARKLSILSLLQTIHCKLMRRLHTRRDTMKKHDGKLCPKIEKKLEKLQHDAFQWEADWSGSFLYQVKCGTKQFVVDMKNRTCACRQWDISGIPCVHVLACILKENDNPWKWVSHWYTVDTYMKSYSHMINPINGQDMWPPSALIVERPNWVTSKRGRKQTVRRRQPEELVNTNTGKMIRKRHVKMKCGLCGQTGHNRRFHGAGAASGNSEELGKRTEAEEEYMAEAVTAYEQSMNENVVVDELLYSLSSDNSQPPPMYFEENTQPTKLPIRRNPTFGRPWI